MAQVGEGYAFGQLRRALRHAGEGSPRAARWRAVLDGMADGTLTVGSRTPVADTPAWVTLEVVHGGFATGRYLAEAPLRHDEREVVAALPADAPGTTDRERLNLYYLSDAGQAVLLDALTAGTYRVGIPEHAALLTVTWLLAHDHHAAALDVVAELRPLMHRLRFTPYLDQTPATSGSVVHVATVGQVRASLRAVTTPRAIATMRTRLAEQPLYDRLVALWCDTVDGDLPRLENGRVVGGWPCRVWPADWAERRARLLAETEGVARHPRANFTRLRAALLACEIGSGALSGRDVGWVRRALANTLTKRGAPESAERTAYREHRLAVAARPTHAALARVVAQRLEDLPADGGVPQVDPFVADVDGHQVPSTVDRKVTRALAGSVEELVERGVITSGEVLAQVLPQITASLLAANIDDPLLSALYGKTYVAFRRRRGLLLLDLAHQVRIEELPWVAAIEPLRVRRPDTSRAARQALAQTVLVACTAFPHAILPNPLVTEFGALAKQAGLALPLVEEIAADIFTGTFTKKFRDAAAIAHGVVAGTLYGRHYDLTETWTDRITTERGQAVSFAELCAIRAGEARGESGSATAESGVVLEQAQILTTHNLAVLVHRLGLGGRLAAVASGLAGQALSWAVRRMAMPFPHRHAALIAVKNAAYAWRQGIFFLGFCDTATQRATVDWLRPQLHGTRLAPALDGLAAIVAGERFDARGRVGSGRRWLGWSTGGHWALDG
ncbi:hypothetical protein JCM33774_15870 [Actinophytocola sp. KF-1]